MADQQTTTWVCPDPRCAKLIGVPETQTDLVTLVAQAICENYGDDWLESPVSSAGCYGNCQYLPGRDDWREMAEAAIAAYEKGRP